MTRRYWQMTVLALQVAVASGCAGDTAAGLVPAVTLGQAIFSDCNGVIVGLDIDLTLANHGASAFAVTEVHLRSADGSVLGTSGDIMGMLVGPGLSYDLQLTADSCVDPALHLSTPTAATVDLTVDVRVLEAGTGDTAVATVTTSMVYARGFDNCASGFGSPGEGCGTW